MLSVFNRKEFKKKRMQKNLTQCQSQRLSKTAAESASTMAGLQGLSSRTRKKALPLPTKAM